MSERLDIDWKRIRKRWLVYFDLLGFSELVKDSNLVSVFYGWELCLNDFRRNLEKHPELEFANFSDSFLIYAPDDSISSFGKIDNCARWFFDHVLLHGFPLRGAMACDEFYGDKQNGVFLGKALVTAHEFGEQFNWIGYTLSPSALSRMRQLNFPDCPCHFRKSDVPTKSGSLETIALLCGNGKGHAHTRALEEMRRRSLENLAAKQTSPEQIRRVAEKYDNTIQFIKRFEMA